MKINFKLIKIIGVLFFVFAFNFASFAQDADASQSDAPLISAGLYLSYGLTIIAFLGATLVPVLNAIRLSDTKSLIKLGAGIGAMLLLFVICRAISSDEVLEIYKPFGVEASLSKSIGGGLIMTYVFTIIAIIGIVYTEIKGFLN